MCLYVLGMPCIFAWRLSVDMGWTSVGASEYSVFHQKGLFYILVLDPGAVILHFTGGQEWRIKHQHMHQKFQNKPYISSLPSHHYTLCAFRMYTLQDSGLVCQYTIHWFCCQGLDQCRGGCPRFLLFCQYFNPPETRNYQTLSTCNKSPLT